jgi:N-acyl-D-amino-acid deacylase
MHDLVIRGATIIDGTGAESFAGDVTVDNGTLTSVGGTAGAAQREVNADGALITPGWVDIHTHYDGQATWDPLLMPSSLHGVTTLLFGNCGVGFAPAKPQHRESLIELMEGVEDIPGSALVEGLEWDWETFPEFLDALERRERVLDVGAQMPHHALRVYVMGERAIRHERASAADIAEMARLTEEAIRAGAFGFTTSRTDQHKTVAGEMVPGRYSEAEELLGIGKALGAAGRGAFGLISDFEDEAKEFEWLTALGQESGLPVWFLLTDRASDPQRWRRLISGVKRARKQGAALTAQVPGRPIGLILGLNTSLNPFSIRPAFKALEHLDAAERLARLRDPEVRRVILADTVSRDLLSVLPPLTQQIATRWDRTYLLGDPPNYEPEYARSVQGIAEKEGLSPQEVAYDYLVGGDGTQTFFFPVTGYVTGDLEPIRAMMTESVTLLGLSDGGAHCGVICDASLPTFMMTHWARDRSRGERLPVEWIVNKLTGSTADFFGFHDRGRLRPGLRADFNLIDFDNLRLHRPKISYDLPAGGKRLLQDVDGYLATFVAGQQTFDRGQATGALPGRLVRSQSK